MTYTPVTHHAVAFLQAHPEYHALSPRKMAALPDVPKYSRATWDKARKLLKLPPISKLGMKYQTKTRKQERKAADALYPVEQRIVIDTLALKIVFHGENGYKVNEKRDSKALAASMRLFRRAKFVTREHNVETGIIVMTLEGSVAA
ncbi:MAG: hypothetical protein LCI00_17035 [Chloroflexi bacterium]|nr:hypothetical protein [Chloroflexota bacterium]